MKTTSRFLLCMPVALAVLLVLSACGNKGPLVMPQTPVQVEEQVIEPELPADEVPVDEPTDEVGQEPQMSGDGKDE